MKYKPIAQQIPHMLHGADYNPDQWLEYPAVLQEDVRLMNLAGCNVMSVGIFAWSTLEPEENVYDFGFLDDTIRRLNDGGVKTILATPSGARPAWMSQKYPEVLRTNADRSKNLHGRRHNHCLTSPYYREKVREMNRRLAERYGNNDAVVLWHISNEYGGECHCDLCQDAFRTWLKSRYGNDLDALNRAYWSRFWSHTYTSWEQIESPSPLGETAVHALNLDWKRFVTHQTIDFMKNEIQPLKEITPHIPVTTNFMGVYEGLDYFKFKDIVDVVSWDNYPEWHAPQGDAAVACESAFLYDLNRSIKDGRPFMLMESTPSHVNWKDINKLKRPGMHSLSSLQAVAHGSDTVQYFQWRKSRGSSEKLHGAVVDHCGHEDTRVFGEVASLGRILAKLDEVVGAATESQVALVYDWENRWALEDLQGLQRYDKKYVKTCYAHYKTFWENGINVDIIDSGCDFSKYKLVVAPMLYMLKPGAAEKIKGFVESGGVIVCTYATGWVDESDLCWLGGFPGNGLDEVFGIWAQELDTLYEGEQNKVKSNDGRIYSAVDYCELLRAKTAQVLCVYDTDFYRGMPAVTRNRFGSGEAYYVAFRDDGAFLADFYSTIISEKNIKKALAAPLPKGVTAQVRVNDTHAFVFIQNYNAFSVTVDLDAEMFNMVTRENVTGPVSLEPFEAAVLRKAR